jgi:hypothetical protein
MPPRPAPIQLLGFCQTVKCSIETVLSLLVNIFIRTGDYRMANQIFSVKLSGTPPTVLALDNDVLECFFEDGSTRVHVVHIKGIELAENNGKYLLTIHFWRRDVFIWVDVKELAPVKELIGQVKQAIAASQS